MPGTWALTNVTSALAWEDTLEIVDAGGVVGDCPCSSVACGAMGGSASLAWISEARRSCAPHSAAPGPEFPGHWWWGYSARYLLTVAAPGFGNTQTLEFEVWRYDDWALAASTPANVVTLESIAVPVTCTITGLVLAKQRTTAVNYTRSVPWDFTDQTVDHTWFAQVDAAVTVAGGGLSVSGDLAGAGAVVELGDSFNFSATIAHNNFPAADHTYGRHSDTKAFNIPLDFNVTLYNPGTGDAPSTALPDWKRAAPGSGAYLKLVNDGGIALQRSAVSSSGGTGEVIVTAPVKLNYKGDLARKWDPDGATYGDLKVIAEPRDWVDGAWVAHEWAFGSDYSQTQFPRSWLFEYEYRFLSDAGTIQVTTASREAQNEDVGGSAIAQNDQQLAILSQPLSGGVSGNPLWPMVGITHLASVDLNDPVDATGRPSLWTALTGASVSGGDNDAWAVTAGAIGPRVTRELATRYWLRLGNLEGYSSDPALPRNFDWPIICRPNQHTLEDLGDDAAWDATVPFEDEWHWAQFSYLRLGLTAPKAGDVTLRVDYSTVSVYDPCYSSVEYRAGDFEYTRTRHVATYTVTVAAGANDLYIDLACPNEGYIPTGSTRMMHVD
jgi:hypothetical protein